MKDPDTLAFRIYRPWYKHPRLHVHHWKVCFPWARSFEKQPF